MHLVQSSRIPVDTVVLVADKIEARDTSVPLHFRRDLEKSSEPVLKGLLEALEQSGYPVQHLDTPEALYSELPVGKRALVLSTYAGETSRSRTSLVPAVCETLGLTFVGLDAHGQALCHDKWVTKQIARDCGLLTPHGRVLRRPSDLKYVSGETYPLIVKPLTEGTSIGISQDSLVRSREALVKQVETLWAALGGDILVEDFVAGREVGYSAIGTANGYGPVYRCLTEIRVASDPRYFEDKVWSADEKKNRRLERDVETINDSMDPLDQAALERFLRAIGDFGYMRIDGRLKDGRFHFIEATPDAFLGAAGHMVKGFINEGWTYAEVINAILETARPKLLDQPAIG